MPCHPALNCQSAWIFCSAPEMTTVSKPNRNPASAEVIDQKNILLFIQMAAMDGRPAGSQCRRAASAQVTIAGADSLPISRATSSTVFTPVTLASSANGASFAPSGGERPRRRPSP
jgi:hypothetical protein